LPCPPGQTPDAQAFELIRTAIEAGSTLLNTGYFYGNPPNQTANLELLSRFFKAHPDLADKAYVSVKGGLGENFTPNASTDNLRDQVQKINSILGRKMDLFEMARVDKETGIEQVRRCLDNADSVEETLTLSRYRLQTMKNLLVLRDEGHFRDIGLSESVSGPHQLSGAPSLTIRHSQGLCRVHPQGCRRWTRRRRRSRVLAVRDRHRAERRPRRLQGARDPHPRLQSARRRLPRQQLEVQGRPPRGRHAAPL